MGRDPAEIKRSVSISDDRGANNAQLLAKLIERVEAYIAAGATDFVFGLSTPFDLTSVEALIEWRAKLAR